MNKTWTVNANGTNHSIEYKRNRLIVDGQIYKLKSSNWFVQMIDFPSASAMWNAGLW